jgi:hypothetical protein
MRKPLTGEPDAGDPHVRFGGEGASAPLPNPSQSKARTRGVEVAAGNNPRDQSNAAAGYGGERSEPSAEVSP